MIERDGLKLRVPALRASIVAGRWRPLLQLVLVESPMVAFVAASNRVKQIKQLD